MQRDDIARIIRAQGHKPRIAGEYVYAVRLSPYRWRKGLESRCLGRVIGVQQLSEERFQHYMDMRFHL